ncbi:MAG: hypothetical protein AAGU77_13830, partial [Bacillota bacterium]
CGIISVPAAAMSKRFLLCGLMGKTCFRMTDKALNYCSMPLAAAFSVCPVKHLSYLNLKDGHRLATPLFHSVPVWLPDANQL